MQDVIILGTGGSCLDLLDLLGDANRAAREAQYRCIGFLDDNPAVHGQELDGCRVLGPLSSAREYPGAMFLNGIGSPSNFWKKPEILATTGLAPERFVTVTHPSAAVSRHAHLGWGVALFPGVTVGTHALIGNHVIALPGAILSHDSEVGEFTCIAGGASVSGMARVGTACYLGTNCSIGIGVTLGNNVLVGMGAVVLRDVPENTVVVGNPARALRKTR